MQCFVEPESDWSELRIEVPASERVADNAEISRMDFQDDDGFGSMN